VLCIDPEPICNEPPPGYGCFEPCGDMPGICIDPPPGCNVDAFAPDLCFDPPPIPLTPVCEDPPIGCYVPCKGGPAICKDPPKISAVPAPPDDPTPAVKVSAVQAVGADA